MKPDFGVFVVWPAAKRHEDEVLTTLASRFEIRGVHRITWSPDLADENFGRFYRSSRLTPPFHTYFRHQKGSGPFTVITVLDDNPAFEFRETNKGVRRVNARFFDTKSRLRDLTRLLMVIHSTETPEEALRDTYMLFGMTPERYLEAHGSRWDGSVFSLERDLPGARGWDSLHHVFDALSTLVPYVVLRNFENLPSDHVVGSHDDIDLLVEEYHETVHTLNARPMHGLVPRAGGRFFVNVSGSRVVFDIRYVGDNYFDRTWQRDVLARRDQTHTGVFVPCERDYFETLAYHALVHKRELTEDYAHRLSSMATAAGWSDWTPERLATADAHQLLERIVAGRGRRHVRPEDATVFYNFAAAGWRFAWPRRKLAGLRRNGLVRWWRVKAPLVRAVRETRSAIARRFPVVRRVRRSPGLI
jgi:hypothetical protein